MNREKVIALAREAKLPRYFRTGDVVNVEQLERFVTLIEKENDFNPDLNVVTQMVEEHQRMSLRIEELENILCQVLIILGPTPTECCGCAYELQLAIDLIKRELEDD